MKTLENFIQHHPRIVLIFVLGLLGITIYLCLRNLQLDKRLSVYEPKTNSSVTVQTYGHDPDGKISARTTRIETTKAKFSLVPDYSGQMLPSRILYWNYDYPSSVISQHANQTEPSSGIANIAGRKSNSMQDSLVQFLLDNKTLKLSFYDKELQDYTSTTYNIELDRYKYNWTSSGLTYKKSSSLELEPYLQSRYLPFSKTVTLGTGLSFKTRKIDYNIGLSLIHDPKFDSSIRPDLEISITYKFKKWLR